MASVMKQKPTAEPRYPTSGRIHMLSSSVYYPFGLRGVMSDACDFRGPKNRVLSSLEGLLFRGQLRSQPIRGSRGVRVLGGPWNGSLDSQACMTCAGSVSICIARSG